jgi:hypothetical protein
MYSLNVDIKKTQKDLLETLSSRSQFVCNNIKTFDRRTTYKGKIVRSSWVPLIYRSVGILNVIFRLNQYMVYALNVQAAMFYVIMCVYILCKRCPLWIVPSRFKCIVTSFLLTLLTTGQTYSFILRNMSHTIYAAKFEQTIIHQHVHLRRESLSHAQ